MSTAPNIPGDQHPENAIEALCCPGRGVDPAVLEQVIRLAVEIAREGREGRKIGTIFAVGDEAAVMAASRPLILDPLHGHPDDSKRLPDPDIRETVKELAQLDGGFVVSATGVVLSAARYFDTRAGEVRMPLGLGSRHMAGASISRTTKAVAVVVSESSVVRMFDDGELKAEILPELWLLRREQQRLAEAGSVTRREGPMTVVAKPAGAG